MIHRIPVNNLSSLWKREAGRDFWEGRFKPLNCYKTWNPEGRQLESMAIRSFVILPLASPAKRGIEDLVPEDRLQLFQVQGRSDPEHAPPVKASVRYQDMEVGIEPQEIAKGLDGDDRAGDGVSLRHRLPEKEL